jgi:hypothetical protein
MIHKNETGRSASGRRRRRREEQLELELAPPNDAVVRPVLDLSRTSRVSAASDTQTKRLRNGVLVQQMLK